MKIITHSQILCFLMTEEAHMSIKEPGNCFYGKYEKLCYLYMFKWACWESISHFSAR